MAVDTPARIAIVGAGPVGLEAALYARFLGYDVDLYERGDVADNVLRWGHVRLFTPWRLNVSPLAIAALSAQDPSWQPPPDDALLTGREFADRYLLPLAHSDLLIDGLRTRTEVVAVGREGQLKGDHVGDEARIDADFRLLLRSASGSESIAAADLVIDVSGTFGNHNWAGASGIPAPGERAAVDEMEYGLPDVLGRERERYAGKVTLLVGDGYSAATSAVALAELAAKQPETRIIWATRRPVAGPIIAAIQDDPLPERRRTTEAANALAAGASASVEHRPSTVIEAIDRDAAPGRLTVRLAGAHPGSVEVDRILANVGYRPDHRLYAELQVHQSYLTDGPMKLAEVLARPTSDACLDQMAAGPQALINPEPDFYILGAKSYGRDSRFLLSQGLVQIRNLFSLIGDRADLDLYGGFKR